MRNEPAAPTEQVLTENEFYTMGEDCNYQFLGGELVMEPNSLLHEQVFAFLDRLVGLYLEERGGGIATGSRYPMRLDSKWSPEPDLMVVLDAKRHLLGQQRLEGPADLVVEIASSSDPEIDLRRKLPRYREAEVPEMWLIDPYARSIRVEVFTPDGFRTHILAEGRLASAVLPGFWIDVAWLWQEPLPPVLACLRQILA
jgi:Uma2 family endonuclease